ncbi:MAG TPA: PASTA domain-containing protein [Baekduia sp.]|uniref:PASTA domain-containing protein n=1 Tax=Baekduia sp. TaxID=2600305 RepID=UPI002D766192|nr:PASTA domain-containing protein [Baekduia sp.]HET6509539.1 PASTA domain-containing protein [Baekduia sp.]
MRIGLLAGAACALLMTGCGGGKPATAQAPVRLQVTTPADQDTVRDDNVEIRGTVSPSGATVVVRGKKASVSGGSWSAQVSLEPGVNVVDVLASSGSARPALTALRVRRVVEVDVPDVTGLSADDAQKQLQDANLKADLQTDKGGFFDQLLGGSPKVCDTDPAASTSVSPGTTVVVHLAREC